jgi:butyryl-CoA dehydrogenase
VHREESRVDFQLSKTHNLLRKMVRDFARKEVKPIATEIDQQERYPVETLEKFFANGFMSFYLPRELGGAGGDTLGYLITIEELAKACPPTGGILSGHNEAAVATICRCGTKEQKEKYLPQLITNRLGGFTLTEPTAGSDANGIQTRAELKGDYYLVNGTKCFVTNGGHAELFIFMAVTDPTIKGGKGKSAFILDKNFQGVTVGKEEKMMGFHAASICELRLNNVKIPKENLLGNEGDGLNIALGGLEGGRVIVAGEALGLAQSCVDEAIAFVNNKKLNGKRLASYQHIQFKLAEMQTQVDAARLLAYKAASMIDHKIPCALEASEAKYFATKTANDISSDAVELIGQYGYTDQYPVERYMRDAKIMEIYEGTNQIQRMVISRALGLKTKE